MGAVRARQEGGYVDDYAATVRSLSRAGESTKVYAPCDRRSAGSCRCSVWLLKPRQRKNCRLLNLRYDVNCPDLSCVDYYWVCCDGAFAWTCYECYTHECSLAVWQNCQCSWSPSAAPMDC